ncbi:MAG TPA: hypothetical protein P5136_00855 [Methanofastidiosum sp.]|nr:hypothetical protein [Methanofastidiosum sp.]
MEKDIKKELEKRKKQSKNTTLHIFHIIKPNGHIGMKRKYEKERYHPEKEN